MMRLYIKAIGILCFIRIIFCEWVRLPELKSVPNKVIIRPISSSIRDNPFYSDSFVRHVESENIQPITINSKIDFEIDDTYKPKEFTFATPIDKFIKKDFEQPTTTASTTESIVVVTNSSIKLYENQTVEYSTTETVEKAEPSSIINIAAEYSTENKNDSNESVYYEDSEDMSSEYDDDYNRSAKTEELETEQLPIKTPNKFSINGLFDFLKNIQKSFVSTAAKGIGNKIKSLQKFRDQLLINIEDRLSQLFTLKKRRLSRELHGHDEHINFPSSEGALITISFLTFAVFLIKLVLVNSYSGLFF